MTQPLYAVTVTIEDRRGAGPIIHTTVSPTPNPAHHSQAIATWLLMRNALAPIASKLLPPKTPKKGRSHAAKSR